MFLFVSVIDSTDFSNSDASFSLRQFCYQVKTLIKQSFTYVILHMCRFTFWGPIILANLIIQTFLSLF